MIKGMLRETYFYSGDDLEMRTVASLDALCPACGFEHSFAVDLVGHGHRERDIWKFNGDYDKPTFSPSMFHNRNHFATEHHPICHSFLEDGVWRYLPDCSHEMAGQRVLMVPPETDATFEQRHSWHLFSWTDDEGKPRQREAQGG